MSKTIFYLFLTSLFINCNNKPAYNDPVPVHNSFSINSKYVNETRIINVWTPPNYNAIDDKFPVLYMLDGGVKEDFPHIANTISKLLKEKKIPPILLVGIENTERGRDMTGFSEVKENEEYCPLTDGAKDFRTFISKELIPEIKERFRTQNQSGIIGESLAGLFVMETFMLQQEIFDFYIAMDPSLWWNNNYLVRTANESLAKFPDKKTSLWFAGSSAEDISKYTKQLAKTLQTHTLDPLNWKYSDEPNEMHHTIFRATKEKALIWTLNKSKQQ